jgi:hypothetical protein
VRVKRFLDNNTKVARDLVVAEAKDVEWDTTMGSMLKADRKGPPF